MDGLRFDGRVAIVTGGGRSLGRAHCLLLAERGATVIVNDLGGSVEGGGADAGPADEVVSEILARGGKAVANTESVATPGGPEALVAAAVETFGRIDIVVTNAGIITHALFTEREADVIRPLLDVHTWGTWAVLRAAWPHFMDQRYGRAVCINSSAGVFGMPSVSAYSAAKAAITGMVRTLALEGADHGIRINALAPGAQSRMTSATDPAWIEFAERHMRPEFVSAAVAYLAHEDCEANGRLFSCLGHRLSEVVLSETRGLSLDPEAWSIEAIRDGWTKVVNRDNAYEPSSVSESMLHAAERMGVRQPLGYR